MTHGATDQQIINGLRGRIFQALGRDNNVTEIPDDQCIEAANRMEALVAHRDALVAALQLMLTHGEYCNWFANHRDEEVCEQARAALAKATGEA